MICPAVGAVVMTVPGVVCCFPGLDNTMQTTLPISSSTVNIARPHDQPNEYSTINMDVYIVACQGGGVSSRTRRRGADKTWSLNPLVH